MAKMIKYKAKFLSTDYEVDTSYDAFKEVMLKLHNAKNSSETKDAIYVALLYMWMASHHGKFIKRDFMIFLNTHTFEEAVRTLFVCVPEDYFKLFEKEFDLYN